MNGYPLLFSDTGTFLAQLLGPLMGWDKPWIYGPVLALVSLRLTLWLPALAQGLLVSWLLWRVGAVFHVASPAGHLALCLLLAAGSAAPWFASLLMPDILAPVSVLALFLLAFEPAGHRRLLLFAVAVFAIAAHLVVAAACLAAILVLRTRAGAAAKPAADRPAAAGPPATRPALAAAGLPLAAALALIAATNLAGHGQAGVSPYGAVFVVARLVADGPAAAYLAEACPAAGYRVCAWAGRLPGNSDEFLWDPDGPVWTYPGGPVGFAPEASRIVVATVLSRPGAVARAALGNWLDQLVLLRLDDVLRGNWLDATVGDRLRSDYPAAESAAYLASVQRTGRLEAAWQGLHVLLVAAGALASFALLVWSWRRDPLLFALIAVIAGGVLGNALATGALAGPHDRYQARIAWLLLLPPALQAMRRWRTAAMAGT